MAVLRQGDFALERFAVVRHDHIDMAIASQPAQVKLVVRACQRGASLIRALKITLDEESTDEAGPTLTGANDQLYLGWLGRDGHINVVVSHNGKTFQSKVTLPEHSHHTSTPGLTAGNGYLYLSWIGTDDKLNLATSTDGVTWSNKTTLEDKSTSTGVSGVTFGNGTLFLDWSGT